MASIANEFNMSRTKPGFVKQWVKRLLTLKYNRSLSYKNFNPERRRLNLLFAVKGKHDENHMLSHLKLLYLNKIKI